MSTPGITTEHMMLAEADTLTNQWAGETRDEALKRSIVVLKPSNKGVGHFTILCGGGNSGLGSPIRRVRFLLPPPQLALEFGDPLLIRAQCRLSHRQLTRWDKPLASFLRLRGN